jgi:hypothetical protein
MGMRMIRRSERYPHRFETIGDLDLHVCGDIVDFYFFEGRGDGRSCYHGSLRPDNFEEMARAMMAADREAAIKAFGAALLQDAPESKADRKAAV